MNPSTADEIQDDNTIIRCIGFAKSWGFGGLYMANLFAFRTSDPKILNEFSYPVGEENDKWLLKLSNEASICIAAWGGNNDKIIARSNEIRQLIPELYYLKINKGGFQPAHPLFLSGTLMPINLKTGEA